MAEWWYNTDFHTSTSKTPFEVVYGKPPPLHLPYLPGESSNVTMDRSMQLREDMIKILRENLIKAQVMMKMQV